MAADSAALTWPLTKAEAHPMHVALAAERRVWLLNRAAILCGLGLIGGIVYVGFNFANGHDIGPLLVPAATIAGIGIGLALLLGAVWWLRGIPIRRDAGRTETEIAFSRDRIRFAGTSVNLAHWSRRAYVVLDNALLLDFYRSSRNRRRSRTYHHVFRATLPIPQGREGAVAMVAQICALSRSNSLRARSRNLWDIF